MITNASVKELTIAVILAILSNLMFLPQNSRSGNGISSNRPLSLKTNTPVKASESTASTDDFFEMLSLIITQRARIPETPRNIDLLTMPLRYWE